MRGFDDGHAVLNSQGFFQDRVPPVDKFEPVCSWCQAEELRLISGKI